MKLNEGLLCTNRTGSRGEKKIELSKNCYFKSLMKIRGGGGAMRNLSDVQ